MEWEPDQNSTPPSSGERMKRVAHASEPPVVVPIVVVTVHVHVTLVLPQVEDRVALCEVPSIPPPAEYSA